MLRRHRPRPRLARFLGPSCDRHSHHGGASAQRRCTGPRKQRDYYDEANYDSNYEYCLIVVVILMIILIRVTSLSKQPTGFGLGLLRLWPTQRFGSKAVIVTTISADWSSF